MLPAVAQFLVGLVAMLHIVISISEIFLWKKPVLHEWIGFNQAEADKAAPIVANAAGVSIVELDLGSVLEFWFTPVLY